MSLIGSIGEHLVAVDLMKKGYRVSMAGAGFPYDLVVEVDQKLYRVQVKATQQKNRRLDYVFRSHGHKHRDYDIIAFVAIDCGAIAYRPFFEAAGARNIFKPPASAHHKKRKGRNLDQYPFLGAINLLHERRILDAAQNNSLHINT